MYGMQAFMYRIWAAFMEVRIKELSAPYTVYICWNCLGSIYSID